MLSAIFESDVEAARRSARKRNMLKAAAFVVAALASANAGAGLLEKLLAPAVGTKAGFSEGKKVYDEDTLKPDELTACILKAHDIDERSGQAPADTSAIIAERDALKKEADDIVSAAQAMKDKGSITEEEAKKHNDRIAAYSERQKKFNEQVNVANTGAVARDKAVRTELNSFIDTCSGRRFYRSDLEAIRPKLPFDISGILAGKK